MFERLWLLTWNDSYMVCFRKIKNKKLPLIFDFYYFAINSQSEHKMTQIFIYYNSEKNE